MKNSVVTFALTAGFATFSAAAAPAPETGNVDGNLRTTRVDVVRSGSGLCWRLGYWTRAQASIDCDPELVPRAAVVPITPPSAPEAAPPPPVAQTPPVAPEAPMQTVISTRALFDFDRAELRPGAREELDKAITERRNRPENQPERRVRIEGHADRIGDPAYNQQLSERRAAAVRDYMISQGFQADQIQIAGYGSTRPVTDGCTAVRPFDQLVECLQPDRRVEMTTEPLETQAATGIPDISLPAR